MDVTQVMADPLSFGANLIIYGTLQGADKTRLVAVDMGVLLTRNCRRPAMQPRRRWVRGEAEEREAWRTRRAAATRHL